MSAAVCLSEPPPVRLQRADGALRVAVRRRDGVTALADLHQQGCLKARFPRPVDWMETVLLNTAGGVAGGDRLSVSLDVAAGAAATFSTQAAERFYRARPEDPPARLATTIRVGAGAAAEWLPQESILFDRCALDRRLDIDLAEDAWFLGIETLVFGRALMGERVAAARIADTIRVRRAGALLLHDAVRLAGPVADLFARPAIAGGAAAVAALVHAAPDVAAARDALRAAWVDAPAETGASAWNGLLVGRILAADGARLRATIVSGLAALRDGRALPRVWMC